MYDTVVLGGTYAAVGFCSASQRKNLIISDSIYLEDYSPAFRFAPVRWQTVAGREWMELLPQHTGIVSLGEAAQMVYRRAQERNWDILYQTFVREIIPEQNGYVIRIQNWDGTRNIPCRRVLDTRPVGRIVKKAYHCLVEHAPEIGEYETFSILRAYWKGQYVLRVPLAPEDTMQKARQKVRSLLEQQLQGTKLILMGITFDQQVEPRSGALPSCNFENLIESYERGYQLGGAK